MTTLVPGFYGKLPSHGDFVRRRLSGSFVGLWDAWLQNAIASSKQQLGADWLEIYLNSPIWRFVFTPGVCGPDMSAGILMPSVDRAGRYFPLTMVVSLPDPVNPLPLAAEYDDWFRRAEAILLTALDDSAHFELDAFDRQVEDCVLEFTSPPKLPAGAEATVFPGHGKSWHIGIASADHLGASLRHLHWKQLGAHFSPLSMWWTDGSRQVAPSALLCEGIPPADSYAAMLDGNWSNRHWPSIQLDSVSRIRPTPPRSAEGPAVAEGATAGPVPAGSQPEPPAGVPGADVAQSQAGPASQAFIPEFDPLEITAPRAGEGARIAESPEPDRVAPASHDVEAPPMPHPAATPPPADFATTPSHMTPESAPPVHEIDPLDAISAAQGTDTPLDPLEALGLSQGPGDDFGVSDMPVSHEADSQGPPRAAPPAREAPPYVEPVEPAGPARELTEAGEELRPEADIPADVEPTVTGPVYYSAAATDAGGQRDFNEDALLERRDMALWAVADGSGGHWVGDVASQAVVSELATVSPSAVLGDMADDVKRRLLQAHQYLRHNLDRSNDADTEAGAAVAVFVATETMSACLSAGPVRAYRYRPGASDSLTRLDGSSARLVGHEGELLVDSRFQEVEVGDWYLLCSRGLYGELDEGDIAGLLSGSSPQDVCERLMSEALARGARDNLTVVVVRAAAPDEA